MRISDWSSDVCSSDLARCTRSTAAPPPSVPRYARTRTRATCSTACKASTPSDWTCRGACPPPHSQPDGVTTMSFRLLLPLLLAALPAAPLASTPLADPLPLHADEIGGETRRERVGPYG